MNKVGYCLVAKTKQELLNMQPIHPDYICNFSTVNYFTLPDGRIAAEIWDEGYVEHIIRITTAHLTSTGHNKKPP